MKPEKVFRIGSVSASVFVNAVQVGNSTRQLRNVRIQRRYQGDDGDWKSTTSFSLSELPQLQTVVKLATAFVSAIEADATTDLLIYVADARMAAIALPSSLLLPAQR